MEIDQKTWLIVLAIGYAIYAIYVTLKVVNSEAFTASQKFAQSALVWLVPVLGLFVVHYMVRHATSEPKQRDKNFDAQKNPTLGQR